MKQILRPLAILAAAALVAGACTSTPASTAESSVTSPPTTANPTTTEGSTSTITPSTTTTEPAVVPEVTATGDLPPGLLDAVSSVLTWQQEPQAPNPDIPEGLADNLRSYPIETTDTMTVTGSTATLDDGWVAVVETGNGDILLGADEGDGWAIVGARPANGPAWYGDEPRMVMVIGSDARPGENQQTLRADSIHILTANPSTGSGTILGFPRDSYVTTPFGSMKFSSVMAGRGPQVMVDTVVNTWDLPVEGYVVTGFRGFEDLMGAVGNLPIVLPLAVPEQAEWTGFRAGRQTLTPQRTLEYSRTRKKIPGGDFAGCEQRPDTRDVIAEELVIGIPFTVEQVLGGKGDSRSQARISDEQLLSILAKVDTKELQEEALVAMRPSPRRRTIIGR